MCSTKVQDGRARRAAPILLPLLMAGLAACTATRSATPISAPRIVEASQAMIMPAPGGPAVISVIEERFSDGVEQKVVLGTDATNAGQNYLGIRIYGPMERETQGLKSLGYKPFTAAALSAETARAVPGVAMRRSALFLRNNYGPFGYAFGQTRNGDSCIFGWQQLRSSEAERRNFRNVGAIQIRLRLCENGASEKELLAVMYGYTVTGSFSSDQWNPFGKPKVDSPAITSNDPIYPNDSELTAPAKVATVRPPRRKVPVAAQPADEEDVKDESAAKRIVDVPAPGGTDGDTTVTPDAAPEDRVVVPGPDCPDGSASCN